MYKFSFLQHDEVLLNSAGKQDIFIAMKNKVMGKPGLLLNMWDTDGCDSEFVVGDRFYIAHNLLLRKGKVEIFAGELVQTSRADLLEFLKHALDRDDMRNFLISPIFDNDPVYVVLTDEDGNFLLYQ